MKRYFIGLAMALTGLLGCGCSTEASDRDDAAIQDRIPITFTLATPGSEGVIYPKGATRATHDAPEYAIKQLSLLVYDATTSSAPKFLRKHDLTHDITLYDNGNGTYTFSIEMPIADMNAKRKFLFVANDDAAVASVSSGSAESDLKTQNVATIVLTDRQTADKLAEASKGIVMSGTATTGAGNSDEVVTITPGVKCSVKLTRIVGRIDVQNNTPNMKLVSAELVGAATKGYLFGQSPLSAPSADRITLGSNTSVNITEEHTPGTPFAAKTFKKVFYMYERPNTAGDYAAVRISYLLNGTHQGVVEVPFLRAADGGGQTPVDITRNHLYTIVLGNGEPVTTNEVKFSFRVEDWNMVELPEEIGPDDPLDPASQKKLNDALKVNMFTEFNAKAFDLDAKTITEFYSALAVSKEDCPVASYVSWNDLQTKGALDAEFTGPDSKKYRLPTGGEQMLLVPIWTVGNNRVDIPPGTKNGVFHPFWNDHPSTNTNATVIVTTPFTETLYFKNTPEHKPDKTHLGDPEYTLSGISQMKVGELTETITSPVDTETESYNMKPVYGLRFKGTNQYAAYRWENCKIDSDPLQRYFSIKIKALHPKNTKTTIDMVANEAFWRDGYIEFKVPASGFYGPGVSPTEDPDNCASRGFRGHFWSSTKHDDMSGEYLHYHPGDIAIGMTDFGFRFPLRFVKVAEQTTGND